MSTTQHESAPQITYVYRFYNSEDELLYVGITKSLEQRFRAHAKSKPWFGEVARSATERCRTLHVALAKESKAILTENPKYNKAIPTMERHELLNVRAGSDPAQELSLIERLKAAEDANRRYAFVASENERLCARNRGLTEQLDAERESAFTARADAVKLAKGARDALNLLSGAESEAEGLRRQLAAAQRTISGLQQELRDERSAPLIAKAFTRLRGVPAA